MLSKLLAGQRQTWTNYKTYFKATSVESKITLKSYQYGGPFLLDEVSVQKSKSISTTDLGKSAIQVTVDVGQEHSIIHAKWHFEDVESPVIRHIWAIGTVKGMTCINKYNLYFRGCIWD